MAFIDDWDVTTPTGAEAASLGDNRIRELKRALDERLGSFFAGWPDTDPLTGTILVGPLSTRPSPPVRAGMVFYATNTDELYVSAAGTPVNVWRGPIGAAGEVEGGLGQTFFGVQDHRSLVYPSAGSFAFGAQPRACVVLRVRVAPIAEGWATGINPLDVSHAGLTAAGFNQSDIITVLPAPARYPSFSSALRRWDVLSYRENDVGAGRLRFWAMPVSGNPVSYHTEIQYEMQVLYSTPLPGPEPPYSG